MFKSLYTRISVYSIIVMLFSASVSFLCTNIIYHNFLKENNDAKIMRTLKDSIAYQKESKIDNPVPFFKHLGEMNYQVMTVSNSGNRNYYGAEFRKDNINNQDVRNVLKGKDYNDIEDLSYNTNINGLFENITQKREQHAFT